MLSSRAPVNVATIEAPNLGPLIPAVRWFLGTLFPATGQGPRFRAMADRVEDARAAVDESDTVDQIRGVDGGTVVISRAHVGVVPPLPSDRGTRAREIGTRVLGETEVMADVADEAGALDAFIETGRTPCLVETTIGPV